MDIDDDADDWPVSEDVLRSLSEPVRPVAVSAAYDEFDAIVDTVTRVDTVAADVQMCLAERVTFAPSDALILLLERQRRRRAQRRIGWPLLGRERDGALATALAARRKQTRLMMTVPSTYKDGKYYAPQGASYVSRAVEELSLWTPADGPPPTDGGDHAFIAGTVRYDCGVCHLHGLVDPGSRVAVDCSPLTDTLPRQGSAVKMYCTLRADDGVEGAAIVLVPHHFQRFSRDALLLF